MALLKNQIALVTGGSSGIGKEIAKHLAQEGATVIIFGRDAERGAKAVVDINNTLNSAAASFYQVDVSNTEAVKETIKQVLEKFSKVDILINNAGITRDQLLIRMSESDWDDVMDINVKSCYNLSHALLRPMIKARKGKIINISSVVGLTGNIGQANYAASKAAICGFTKALAKEVASKGICVNCVAPGLIKTPMSDEISEEQKKRMLDQIPLGRLGEAAEIAKAVIFLAGPGSDYITGQVLTIDGGMVM